MIALDPILDKLPPHDRGAERGLLGGLFRDPDILPTIQASLSASCFYFDAHQKIFRALCDIATGGNPVDLVSLHDELRRRKELEDIGGVAYLTELWEAVPTGANAEYHAKLIRECSTVRALIHAANEILRDAYDRSQPTEDLLASAERKVLGIADGLTDTSDTIRSMPEVLRDELQRIDQRIASGGKMTGLATGYVDLDDVLGGLEPGELVVIGARPSTGKTALAVNVLVNVAGRGEAGLFFSLEQPERQIAGRLLSMGSGVPMHRFSRGRGLSESDASRLCSAASDAGLGGTPIYLDDTSGQTAARVSAVTRRAVRRLGVQVVVVDYLQLMAPENPRDNKHQQVGTLALRMKHLAREAGVSVILLSQLNREVEGRPDRKPRLCDLKESGDIEAHADRVLLMYRDPTLAPELEVWPIGIDVAKNRNGPIGEVTLAYRRPVLRFENHQGYYSVPGPDR